VARDETYGSWPKPIPDLTAEQRRIQDDRTRHWLDCQPERHSWIERINNAYPLQHAPPRSRKLEIWAGIGAHIRHEDLERQEYYAVELRRYD
jgi:hypothetical protein